MQKHVQTLVICLIAIGLLILPISLRAAAADAPGDPLPAGATVDEVLDSLDQAGKDLKDFEAKVKLTEGDPNLANYTTRTGMVAFQKTDDGNGRIHVVFNQRIIARVSENRKVEYLLDGQWLVDRDYDRKIEVKRQVLKPGEKMNLLKLGEGPFPLPIGQDKQEVHKQFEVSLEKADKDDPQNTIHLLLKPKADTRLARRFSTIDVWVDRKLKFPVRIDTVDPNGSMEHKTDLSAVRLNITGGLREAQFILPNVDQSAWDLHTEPYHE